MPALTIKNIPSDVLDKLKKSARSHRRSINGKAIHCLEQALGHSAVDPESFLAGIDAIQKRLSLPRITDAALRRALNRGRP